MSAARPMAETTVAQCPLQAECINVVTEPKRKVICGYYRGSMTNGGGSFVKCGYSGNLWEAGHGR